MEFDISLKNETNEKWFNLQDTWIKGFVYDNDNNLLKEKGFASIFNDCNDYEDFKYIVKDLNGIFSVVVKSEGSVFLASDIVRSYPIFYYLSEGKYYISDDANYLKENFSLSINEKLSDEFLFSGYMISDKTLISGLYQVPAHETLCLSNTNEYQEYFSYATDKVSDNLFKTLSFDLLNLYSLVGERLVKALNGRTAVIPLSGGYDSRLVASLLKDQNYSDVLCFSYGVKNSHEVAVAKKVARNLDFDFISIDYNKSFYENNFDLNEFIDYEKYAGNLTSLPHIQDFLSVKYLKNNNKIPLDSVFIPGIAGDIFAGTQIPAKIGVKNNIKEVVNSIENQYLNFNKKNQAPCFSIDDSFLSYSLVENFCVKEKVPKFVANSVRVYEYLGYDFLLPLMDKDLLLFFREVPLLLKNRNDKSNYKISNNLYDYTCFSLFKKYNIDMKKNDFMVMKARCLNYAKNRLGVAVDTINGFDSLIGFIEKETGFSTSFKKNKNINLALSEIYLKLIK